MFTPKRLGTIAAITSACALLSPQLLTTAAPLHNDSVASILLSKSDSVQSEFFRIPFLLRTDNDTLIAGSDANRATTGDSADNIDAVTRTKSNASISGTLDNWQDAFVPPVLDMQDFSNTSGYAQESASVIDAAVFQDSPSGRIYLQIDLFPWNGGVFEKLNVQRDNSVRGGRARTMALGDGFAEVSGRKMLLLSDQNIVGNADGKRGNINRNYDRTKFNYVADVNGDRTSNGHYNVYALNGTPRQYSPNGTDDSNSASGRSPNTPWTRTSTSTKTARL